MQLLLSLHVIRTVHTQHANANTTTTYNQFFISFFSLIQFYLFVMTHLKLKLYAAQCVHLCKYAYSMYEVFNVQHARVPNNILAIV